MKTISLTLRSRDDGAEKIAELAWANGKVIVVEAVPAIAADLDRMISTGLIEWVGTAGSRERRHTPSTDGSFLERVGEYFGRQSGFLIKLVERESAEVPHRPHKHVNTRRVIYGPVVIQITTFTDSMSHAIHLPANQVLSVNRGLSRKEQRQALSAVREGAANRQASGHERN